jgi:hypothetical protein
VPRPEELKAAEQKRDDRFIEIEATYNRRLAEERARLPGQANEELLAASEQRLKDQRHSDRNVASATYFRERDAIEARYPKAESETQGKAEGENKSASATQLERNQQKTPANDNAKGRTK